MILRLDCIRKRAPRASKCNFSGPLIQQEGTYIPQYQSTKRIKEKSRSASKQRTELHNIGDDETSYTGHSNNIYTSRPTCQDDVCTFNFTLFCNKSDQNWYLS